MHVQTASRLGRDKRCRRHRCSPDSGLCEADSDDVPADHHSGLRAHVPHRRYAARPMFQEIHVPPRCAAQRGPKSGQSLAEFGPNSADSTQTRPTPSQTWPSTPDRPRIRTNIGVESGRGLGNSIQHRPKPKKLVRCRWAKIGQPSPQFGRIRPNFSRHRA